jgi:hypothetical protein
MPARQYDRPVTDVDQAEISEPVAYVVITYLGPVAPHWDVRANYGDPALIEGFRARVNARLLLIPRHDPQFNRNKMRVNRDAERELIKLDWDLGDVVEEAGAGRPPMDDPRRPR